jgi:hypothetical protein
MGNNPSQKIFNNTLSFRYGFFPGISGMVRKNKADDAVYMTTYRENIKTKENEFQIEEAERSKSRRSNATDAQKERAKVLGRARQRALRAKRKLQKLAAPKSDPSTSTPFGNKAAETKAVKRYGFLVNT